MRSRLFSLCRRLSHRGPLKDTSTPKPVDSNVCERIKTKLESICLLLPRFVGFFRSCQESESISEDGSVIVADQ
jgi:hypothetical protein